MIRVDTVTDQIAIDTEVWTGSGKIIITRTSAGVSIQYGDSPPLEHAVGSQADNGLSGWYKRVILERFLPYSPL